MKRVAIVTGGNKGIGFEVCKQLAEKGFTIVLTARNSRRGEESVAKLQKEGLDVVFYKLDVTKKEDINKLKKFLVKNFRKVDVLVNNAGVYLDKGKKISEVEFEIVKKTMETNFYGPLLVSQMISPLMKSGGRIINVSSHSGQIHGRFSITSAARAPSYGISKLALNGLTIKLAGNRKGIKVNSVAPGWVRTDMGGRFAPKPVKKGAETIVWLATEEKIPNGKFLEDKKQIEW